MALGSRAYMVSGFRVGLKGAPNRMPDNDWGSGANDLLISTWCFTL